ncbi:MAG: prolipoprotein diacylglyceryl transferase [Pseudomonadota bacterium]
MEFPGIDPIAFQIGPLAVRWYGIAFATTFAFSWWYVRRLLQRPNLWAGGQAPNLYEKLDDLLIYIVAGVILGGRLGHILLYKPDYYLANPLQIFAFWEGGMSFHGGLLGTVIAILIFAARNGVDKWVIGDLVAACSPVGILLVRSANFVNGEIVGSPSNLPWAIVFPGYAEARHPANLYEAALEGAVLFIIVSLFIYLYRTLRFPGLTSGIFLVGYAIARIYVETFKFAPHRMIWEDVPFTKGMAYSVPMFLVGAWLIYTRWQKARAEAVVSNG